MKKTSFLAESLIKIAEAKGLDTTSLKLATYGIEKDEAMKCLEKAKIAASISGNEEAVKALELAIVAIECCLEETDEVPEKICAKLAFYCKKSAAKDADVQTSASKLGEATGAAPDAASQQTMGTVQVLSAKIGPQGDDAAPMGESFTYFKLPKLV